jgi:uncharacterized protein DUF6627
MNVSVMRFVSRWVALCMLALSFQTVQAAMVGTEQVATAAQAQQERERVRDFVARTDVQQQLQSMGVKADNAQDRVAALTDEEVHKIAGKIESLPAGASGGWGIAAAVIIIAVIVYWVWK